jgi:PTS system mannose-specific IIA component
MIGAVIVTHGGLAASLVEVAESIAGRVESVKTVKVTGSDTTDGIRAELSACVKGVDGGGGVIVFTDMFGGTPTNVALSLLKPGAVEIITGVNLPVLLKFLSHRNERPLDDLALMLKEYGQRSIVLAGDILKEKK